MYVTKPSLPALEEFTRLVEQIWETRVLTNDGPLLKQLEAKLCEYLNIDHISVVNNATTALLLTLKALKLQGEVITTPYSFVATSHSILWNGLEPVFVDIDPNTFNIDPAKIRQAITPRTSAILAVHCYGTPCDVHEIEQIAVEYGLKVIYDAAHAFGVRCDCKSLLEHGDASILSFHATKVFNTFEGGAVVCRARNVVEEIDLLKNFGFRSETDVALLGINGKMSEIHAALGVLQLSRIDTAIETRKTISERYVENLCSVKGVSIPLRDPNFEPNFSYFPILLSEDYAIERDALYETLKKNGIYSRRYFYPLISSFPMYKHLLTAQPVNLPNATRTAEQVLCLPIFEGLSSNQIDTVCTIVSNPIRYY